MGKLKTPDPRALDSRKHHIQAFFVKNRPSTELRIKHIHNNMVWLRPAFSRTHVDAVMRKSTPQTAWRHSCIHRAAVMGIYISDATRRCVGLWNGSQHVAVTRHMKTRIGEHHTKPQHISRHIREKQSGQPKY